VPRHLEHNIIQYYELDKSSNLLLQFKPLEKETLEDYLNKNINSCEKDLFQDWLLDSYATYPNTEDFDYLRHSNFNLFFQNSNVDRPRCLLSYWSSRRTINRHLLLKTSNYLMRNGNRNFAMNLLIRSIRAPYNKHIVSEFNDTNSLNWKSIYNILSLSIHGKAYQQFPADLKYTNSYKFNYNYLGKEHANFLDMRNVVLTNINKINPIFSFYIYKVDKAIFKNSRGKSGKYTFIWKYLPPYKRKQLVLAWIAKEVKMHPGRTLEDRISAVINSICYSPSTLFINKVKKFSVNYVYWNSRKSLCETYRTVTK
jgi:hypothetical protein